MTGGARGNVGFGKSFLKDSFTEGDGSPWRPSERFRIETPEMRGQGRQHRRAQDMRDVEHDRVGPPALNEGSQLTLDVFGLLPRQSWHRKISEITLPRQPVACFAIFQLGLKTTLPRRRASVLRVTG